MDDYLYPIMEDKKYTGPGLRVMNERMKRVRLANYRVSRQQTISVDLASTDNAASTATDFAGFIDYTLGYYYHLPTVLPDLKLWGHFKNCYKQNNQCTDKAANRSDKQTKSNTAKRNYSRSNNEHDKKYKKYKTYCIR